MSLSLTYFICSLTAATSLRYCSKSSKIVHSMQPMKMPLYRDFFVNIVIPRGVRRIIGGVYWLRQIPFEP